jgi:hypothetical protein
LFKGFNIDINEFQSVNNDVFEPFQIVVSIDISKSMLAPSTSDPCSPSRLELAVQEVENLIDVLEQQASDRVALVVFARFAYPAIPVLTDDYQLFRRRLEKETLRENVLSMPEGTNYWHAVEQSVPVLDLEKPHKKMLVILTDGETDAPKEVLALSKTEAFRAISQTGIGVYVVGIGEPGMRHPVPVKRRADGCPDKGQGYMVQTEGPDKGRVMTTATDTGALMALAEELGGAHVHSRTGSDLADKMKIILEDARVKVGLKYKTTYMDLSEYMIMFVLFMMAVLVTLKTP